MLSLNLRDFGGLKILNMFRQTMIVFLALITFAGLVSAQPLEISPPEHELHAAMNFDEWFKRKRPERALRLIIIRQGGHWGGNTFELAVHHSGNYIYDGQLKPSITKNKFSLILKSLLDMHRGCMLTDTPVTIIRIIYVSGQEEFSTCQPLPKNIKRILSLEEH